MSGHLPAVRARHQKYLLARLPRDLSNDLDNDDPSQLFSTSVFTAVNTIPFLDRTVVETEVFTVLSPLASGVPITQVPSVILPAPGTSPLADTSTSSPPQASPGTSSSASPSSSSSPPSSSSFPATSSSATPASAATSTIPTPTSTPASADTSASSDNVTVKNAESTGIVPSHSSSAVSANNSAALDASDSSASSQSKGLSGGAIGGIVVAVIAVAIVVAIYAIRKIFLRRRQNRRISWGDAYPKPEFKDAFSEKPTPLSGTVPPPLPEKPVTPIAPVGIPNLAPLQTSYNNPLPPVMTPLSPMPPSATPTLQPAVAAPAVPLAHSSLHAYVRCTFIPNLPDELSITTGELVRVINEYDDGWALCQNVCGEQGVVPLECLDRGHPNAQAHANYLGQGTGDWRMSRRESSLSAAQNAAARY